MLMWCVIVPLLSGIANPEFFGEALAGEVYQMLAWGVPWVLAGSISDTASLRLAAKAFVIAGLLYVPICLVELWDARAPDLCASLWLSALSLGANAALHRIPAHWIARDRHAARHLDGDLGTDCGVAMGAAHRRPHSRHSHGLDIGGDSVRRDAALPVGRLDRAAGGSAALRLRQPAAFSAHHGDPAGDGHFALRRRAAHQRGFGAGADAAELHGSRGDRVSQAHPSRLADAPVGARLNERTVDLALEQPILGSGQWDWWRNTGLRPSGLWLLAFGMFGIFGLIALEALQLIPVVRVVWFPLARSDIEDLNLRHAFVAVILMTAIDNLLNNAMILPLLVVMGGMATWGAATSAVQVEVQAPQEEEFYSRRELERGGPHDDRPLIEGGPNPEIRESRVVDRSATFVDAKEAGSHRR